MTEITLQSFREKKVFVIANGISSNVGRKHSCSGNTWMLTNPTSLSMIVHIICLIEECTTTIGNE